jgi:hypothetical protein
MKTLPRYILTGFLLAGAFGASLLQGRVLCVAGGHAAIEAPHPEDACCHAERELPPEGCGHEGDGCTDLTAAGDLASSRGGNVSVDLTAYAVPFLTASVTRSADVRGTGVLGYGHAVWHPPGRGGLSHLRGIVLLI